jgi:hypothetical protein
MMHIFDIQTSSKISTKANHDAMQSFVVSLQAVNSTHNLQLSRLHIKNSFCARVILNQFKIHKMSKRGNFYWNINDAQRDVLSSSISSHLSSYKNNKKIREIVDEWFVKNNKKYITWGIFNNKIILFIWSSKNGRCKNSEEKEEKKKEEFQSSRRKGSSIIRFMQMGQWNSFVIRTMK